MSYSKCINNRPYLHLSNQPAQEEPLIGLTIGKVYKVIPDPAAEQHGITGIIDGSFGEPGSEDGNLYPSDYFEHFLPGEHGSRFANHILG